MAIEFSLAAEDDLLEIFLYRIQEHELAQAERYKGQLEAIFQTIFDNPTITGDHVPSTRVSCAKTRDRLHDLGGPPHGLHSACPPSS